MGLALNDTFRQSVISNAEDALRNQVLLLMANIDVIDGEVVIPPVLWEARLSQADSSLYAQVSTPVQGNVWQSDSLLGMHLPDLPSAQGEFRFFESLDWEDGHPVFAMSLGVSWETEQGDLPFTVLVAERTDAYNKRLAQYQRRIALWLLVLGASLLALLLALLSWAVKPLVRVTRQVSEIEQGERRRFDEDYPTEVSRLTQNLNQLLNFEEQRINRQKEVLGNLAHSLKTPIAVLKGLDYSETNKPEAERQLGAMQNIIDYQLQSAAAVGRRRFAKPVDISQPTQQIVESLNKLHQDKHLNVLVEVPSGTLFYGDQGDWMELVGNLLDNAYKWSHNLVSVSIANKQLNSHRKAIEVVVTDDGSGIDDQLKSTILQRGVRLDSQTPGHGLGLHIVKGIVEAYDGDLSIQDEVGGGTRFRVQLN